MNPIFAELASMPDFVERAARRLGEARARVPGHEGSFSLVEHAWHLADLETEGFAERIRRLRSEREPFLPDFEGDRVARERQYLSLDLQEGLRRFREARKANLLTLQEVMAVEWDRGGIQQGHGHLALRDLPVLMVQHDRSHREEIDALPG